MRPLPAQLALGLAALAAAPAFADPPSAAADAATVALIDGWREADGSRVAAIEITLAPGSHTYWRVPGEAGIPPSFDWSSSENLQAVRYEWPRPEIIDSYGMRSFGYVGSLVLPVLLTPKDPAAPLELALALSFGVCDDICMQEARRVATRLAPEGAADAGAGRARIAAALAERARSASEAGVARVTCAVAPGTDGYELTATVTFDDPPAARQVAVVESSQPGLWIGAVESDTEGRTLVARAPIAGTAGAGTMVGRQDLRLTVLDDTRAIDIRGCQAPG